MAKKKTPDKPKKKTPGKKSKIIDDNKDLIPVDTAEEIVANVLQTKGEDDRQSKYFLYRMLGLSPKIAARLCNYNEDYGYKLDRKFREDLNLRARIEQITGVIPEQYRALCKLRLLEVAEIEGKAMTEYKSNPKLAIDKPQLLKQVKQVAGLLPDDDVPKPSTINIKAVQNLMLQIQNEGTGQDPIVEVDASNMRLIDKD